MRKISDVGEKKLAEFRETFLDVIGSIITPIANLFALQNSSMVAAKTIYESTAFAVRANSGTMSGRDESPDQQRVANQQSAAPKTKPRPAVIFRTPFPDCHIGDTESASKTIVDDVSGRIGIMTREIACNVRRKTTNDGCDRLGFFIEIIRVTSPFE